MKTWKEIHEEQLAWFLQQSEPDRLAYERHWANLIINHRPPEDWCWAIPTGKPGSPYDGSADEAIDGRIKEHVFRRQEETELEFMARTGIQPANYID